MNHRPVQSRAFTLVELVLVMVVICVAMAIVVPSFRGYADSSTFRDSAVEIVALTHYARAHAIAEGRPYRLNIDVRNGQYWLTAQEQDRFVPLGTEFGRPFGLPVGASITTTGRDGIEFYPNGRCDVADIRLTDSRGVEIRIASVSPAQPFKVMDRTEDGR